MNRSSRFFLLALTLVGLSSCALPPREAWRVVQHDGLIPYIAVELGRRPVPPYVHLPAVKSSRLVTTTSSAKAPRSVTGSSGMTLARTSSSIPDSRYLDTNPSCTSGRSLEPAAKTLPTPVVPPAPRPATAPAPKPPAVVLSKPAHKTNPAPKPAPRPPVIAPTPKAAKPEVDKSLQEELANVPRAKPMPPEPQGEKTAAIAKSAPAKSEPNANKASATSANKVPATANASTSSTGKPAPATATKPTISSELPFGTPIPGRPGLVNSPYAGKYQLVDVTGLDAGQEVKCPYSGKLFRVPGVQQAKNTVTLPTEPPPAKKTQADKKP